MNGRRTSGPRRASRRGAALVVGLALSVAVAGCGGDDGSGSGSGSESAASSDPSVGTVTTAPDGVQEVTIETPDDYVFLPDAITVAPGRVRLTVHNTAHEMVHNFRFTPGTGPAQISEQIPLLQPGASDTIEFEVQAVGDYPFECSFHAQLGQVGTMTVAAG